MSENSKIPVLFPITVFEKLDESGIITKARSRIFYKYANRNGSYISDDFADKLLKSLPGSPIKGIYNEMVDDYTDHGKENTQGRAYGFVPETNHNIAYEDHEDEDGVMRTYACADVFLWTSLYKEAADIVGAPQSMELYEPSIKGEWKLIDGKKMFEFTEGSFLGLQALGKDVEPCFEGAAFFSLMSSFSPELFKVLSEAYVNFQMKSQDNNGGKKNMFTFKLSDNQKANKIFQALNKTEYRYWVHDTFDDFAIVFDYQTESFGKVNFTKDEITEEVTIVGDIVAVFAEYVTADEKTSLNTIRAIKGTYTASLEEFDTMKKDFGLQVTKIEELDGTISTLNTEKVNAETSFANANVKIGELETTISALSTYRDGVEKAAKDAVLAQYSEQLDKATLESFTEEKVAKFTVVELEKELAFAMVKANPTVFSKAPQYTPKHNEAPSGLEAVLEAQRAKRQKNNG